MDADKFGITFEKKDARQFASVQEEKLSIIKFSRALLRDCGSLLYLDLEVCDAMPDWCGGGE
jgi:hypothetical protein